MIAYVSDSVLQNASRVYAVSSMQNTGVVFRATLRLIADNDEPERFPTELRRLAHPSRSENPRRYTPR